MENRNKSLEKLIGYNIKRLRLARGWKQKDLASQYALLSGRSCNEKYISLIETGRRWLGKASFYRFATIFNVDIYELILPRAYDDKFINFDQIHAIMQSELGEKLLQAIDIFLNYRYIGPELWQKLEVLISALHNHVIEAQQIEHKI